MSGRSSPFGNNTNSYAGSIQSEYVLLEFIHPFMKSCIVWTIVSSFLVVLYFPVDLEIRMMDHKYPICPGQVQDPSTVSHDLTRLQLYMHVFISKQVIKP